MSKSKSFAGVTQSVWDCIKTTSESEHGTTYNPPNGDQGTSSTSTPVGDVVLGFTFDPNKDTVTYVIQKKPFLVSDNQIWDGIGSTIEHCQHS